MATASSLPDTQPCKSCQAPVLWLRHVNTGKLAPIDVKPTPGGNIVVVGDRYEIRPLDLLNQDDTPRHTSHFATCPNAPAHRKTAKK